MGIFNWAAKKIKGEEDSEKNVDKSPVSGKRRTAYRDAAFFIQDEATREDLEKVLKEIGKLDVVSNDTPHASREDLAKALEKLVKTGEVPVETVKDSLEKIVALTRDKIEFAAKTGKLLSTEEQKLLLKTIKERFEQHNQDPKFIKLQKMRKGIEWAKVEAKLEANPEKMWSLNEMERTGGEPDVVGYDKKNGEYVFWDLCKLSPSGRRNVCYDREEQMISEAKGTHPNGNAIDMAETMGIKLLNEREYRQLQELGEFDRIKWSWIWTPAEKRRTGGGQRCAYNGKVYIVQQHGHAERGGFRGSLRV